MLAASAALPLVFVLGRRLGLPLHVGGRIGAALANRDDVVANIAGAGAGSAAGRWAGVLSLNCFDTSRLRACPAGLIAAMAAISPIKKRVICHATNLPARLR